jgi:ribosomal protein S20
MLILSFRRSAVLEALASGTANDSIRSAYEHVKALPAPDAETDERKQWPRAKRGPKQGQPRKPAAPKKDKPFNKGWVNAVLDYSEYRDQLGRRAPVHYKDAYESASGRIIPKFFKDEAECRQFVADWDRLIGANKYSTPEALSDDARQAEQEFTENARVKSPVRTIEQLREKIEKEVHARLLKEAQAAVNDYKAELDEQAAKAWGEIYDERKQLERRAAELDQRMKGIRPVMTYQEWRVFTGLCHSDKWPEIDSSDKRIVDLQRLFNALQKLKDRIDPLTPIAELRRDGWEVVAPAYKRKKAA